MTTGMRNTSNRMRTMINALRIRKGQMFYVKGGKFYMDGKGGGRPAVIVSGEKVNNSNRCTVVFLTSHTNGTESMVPVKISDTNTSYAICGELMTIWKNRLENYIGTVSKETMAEIDRQINKCRDLDNVTAAPMVELKKEDCKDKPLCFGCPEKAKLKEKEEIIAAQEKTIQELKIGKSCYKKMYESIMEQLMGAIKGAKS